MTTTILLFLVILLGLAGLFWWLKENMGTGKSTEDLTRTFQENADLKARLQMKVEEVAKLTTELQTEKSERNQLEGKGKQLFAEITGHREENKNLRAERDEMKTKLAKIESDHERQQKDFSRQSEQLENARKKLEEEQARVQQEELERIAAEKEHWNRLWNEHEGLVLAKLKEVCQSPNFGFTFYENTKLPQSFDGSLKPDFLVEFLGQYLIFDAKKSKDLGNYLGEQVKKTVEKIKKSSSVHEIYPAIFFVVPEEELLTLKKTFFYEEGISFFVISINAIEAVLAAYKRITEYERISEFDPQDREKIVDLIARYDRHISLQNAASIVLAKEGLAVMGSKDVINAEVLKEIEGKKRNMRQIKLSEAEVKRLAQNFAEQKKDIAKMVTPKEAVGKEEVEEIQKMML